MQCARGGPALWLSKNRGAPTYRALASECSPAPTSSTHKRPLFTAKHGLVSGCGSSRPVPLDEKLLSFGNSMFQVWVFGDF